ncbi:hypothetical protein AG1IA_09957 [Rhizoctonia solani AG-1 IA]|uniref:Uncharacterized protein n=1 Tax=Thanatephorus cucumeris (strain AG1-IA) TaxID=983506 RepID=L8WGV2_THACA|nr:hypothetical protein AG1IA_09957 [Rhizoctonia solani AG-1 IA]
MMPSALSTQTPLSSLNKGYTAKYAILIPVCTLHELTKCIHVWLSNTAPEHILRSIYAFGP